MKVNVHRSQLINLVPRVIICNIIFFSAYITQNDVYSLLDIDHKQFFLAYFCRNLPDDKSQERIQILTRTLTMNSEIEAKINDYIDRYFDRPFMRKIKLDEAKLVYTLMFTEL